MDIDTYSAIGCLIPLAGIAYAVAQKPKPVAWILLVPAILFLFIGAVSNSGLAPIDGRWAQEGHPRYLYGAVITLAAAVLLVVACRFNKKPD